MNGGMGHYSYIVVRITQGLDLGKGVKEKGKGNVLEILNVSYSDN